ncbi:MAG: PspC domain-containing protein [Gammaproteobacteria bacterium]|nr:PspC domain-containing protein [Gammaproteobacteria bacterium]
MTTLHADSREFYRDADRAILGGVCAGLARYFGFNLRATRILAFIAFLMAMPVAVVGYLAAVFLIPSATFKTYGVAEERRFRGRRQSRRKKEAVDASGPSYADIINRRCRTMDERLARLEKHVTSKRFQIDQELNRL